MVSSSNSVRKQQSLARVAVLGPYAGVVDQSAAAAAALDPAVRTTTPLTALERELRGQASSDSIGAVVATRPDAEELTRKRERRRSLVSNSTTATGGGGGGDGGRRAAAAAGGPRPCRTSMESERSRNRAKLVSLSSASSYSYSSDSPPSLTQEESVGRAYFYEQLARQRAEIDLRGGGGRCSTAVVDDSDYDSDYDSKGRRRSAVLRPTHGNAQSSSSFKAKSEAGYYLSSSMGNSTRDKRRQSRAYPPMVQNGFDEVPHWASDAMKGVVLSNGDRKSSHSSRHHHHDSRSSGRRSSTATVTVPSSYPEREPKTPSTATTATEPRRRKRRGAVSAKSVSGATDDQEDNARSAHSGYSRYSTATYSHYPRGGPDYNPYYSSTPKRTSWRPSSGVDSSRARDLAAAAELQRKLELEQERVRELEREREHEMEREHRRRQKQKQKEIVRVDSVEFEMCSPPSPAGTPSAAPAATTATATTTPKSATPRSPVYDLPSTKSRRSSRSSWPVTAIYLPSQEPAASFDVVSMYRTETVAKHELEPVEVLSKSNFLDGEVYDNSHEDTAAAAAPEPSSGHHRRSRRYSRGTTASRSSRRGCSPARMLEKGVEFKDRVHEALHNFKEDQKARAGIIPPDPNREYYSYYNTHPRERREHRAPEKRGHRHHEEKEEVRPHQRRRVRRSSLQQHQPQPAPIPATVAEPTSSSHSHSRSASSSFAGRVASANTSTSNSPQQQQPQRTTPYRVEMASEAMPEVNDVVHAPPVTSRQDQERQELFCRATRRGGRPEHFLRQPGGSSGGGEVRQRAVTENPGLALRMRAQEKINNEQRLSKLDFGLSGSNDSVGHHNNGGGMARLGSLYMPRSSNNAATAANAAVPESHRRSFFAPHWMQQQQQHLPVGGDDEPSLPKPAESVVSELSFVAGQPEKLDVPPQRPLYAPSSSSISRDDRRDLPSQSPSPPAWGGSGGSSGARRLRRAGDVSISQMR